MGIWESVNCDDEKEKKIKEMRICLIWRMSLSEWFDFFEVRLLQIKHSNFVMIGKKRRIFNGDMRICLIWRRWVLCEGLDLLEVHLFQIKH